MLQDVTTEIRPTPGSAARVIWQATRACERACVDCPMASDQWRDPGELSTIEAMLLLNRLRARGCELLSVTGGDPLRREDLDQLVRHASRLGMEVEVWLPGGIVPPGPGRLDRLRDAGMRRLVVRSCGEAAGDDHAAGTIAAARSAGIPAEEPACGTAFTISPSGELVGSLLS